MGVTSGTGKRSGAVTGVILVACVGFAVLAQGGFFDFAACLVGMVGCAASVVVWLLGPHRATSLPLIPVLFMGLALAYFVSALASGASLTTLAKTGTWAGCAGMSSLAATQDRDGRASTMCFLTWLGIATALGGLVVYTGVLPTAGGVLDGRLQLSFEYANTAGVWYGANALLCLLGEDGHARCYAALPVGALLLTQSAGAVLAFVLVAAAAGVRLARREASDELFLDLLQGVLGAMLFVVLSLAPATAALVAVLAACVACRFLQLNARRLPQGADARKASAILLAGLVAFAVLAFALLPGRVAQAAASMAERWHHMSDGLRLWSTSPLVGIGPNNWQYLYGYIQSESYRAAVIHSSLVQLMVDAGIFGLAAFAGATALGLRALWRAARDRASWARAELCAATLILLHSLVEFDLQFASVAFLLAVLLCAPEGPRVPVRGLVAAVAGLVLCLPLCGVGLMCAATSTALGLAVVTEDWDACHRLYDQNPWARADVAAQGANLRAFFEQGDYPGALDAFDRMPAPQDQDVIYAALACYARGDLAQATGILIRRLETQPRNVDFMLSAKNLAQEHGIDGKQTAAFNAALYQVEQYTAQGAGEG